MIEPSPPAAIPLPGLPAAVPADEPTGSTPRAAVPSSPAPRDSLAAHHAKADSRPADTIWRPNPREQGLLGLTDAIAWFGSRGWLVCLPLNDSQPYDLVVDDGEQLLRVQVKTTTQRNTRGCFVVTLATGGGNQSFHTKKAFDPASCELLYVLTDDRDRFLMPTSAIRARMSLTLTSRWNPYRVGS